MPENFKRFEQGRPQRPLLPSGSFDNHLEQPALLRGGLLQEQLTRPARQPQHVDGLIDRGGHGLLDILDLAQQTILLPAAGGRMLIEKLLRDAPVEFVQVHSLDARSDLVVPGLHFLDGLRAGRLLGLVRGEDSVTKPFEDRLRYDQFLQDVGELTSEDFLARVRLRAFSTVSSAVIVHVPTLFYFAHEQASAVAAVHEPSKSKLVLHLAGFVLGAGIKQALHPLPTFGADEWLVRALVGHAIKIEIAHVQPLAKNLMYHTLVQLVPAKRDPFRPKPGNERVERIPARPEPVKQLRDDPCSVRVGYDDALATGAVGVLVPNWGIARIYPGACLLQHSLPRLFAQVEDVVPRHQDVNPVHQLVRRA